MKLRCPYCRKTRDGEPKPTCPFCGKTMMIPPALLKTSATQRRKAKERIAREAERKRALSGPQAFVASGSTAKIAFALVLMTLLAGAMIGALRLGDRTTSPQDNRTLKALHEIGVLKIALDRYRKDCGVYPTEEQGLKALVTNPGVKGWNGPYVNLIKPDPWKNPYVYMKSNGKVTVMSYGPDGKRDTSDDIIATD